MQMNYQVNLLSLAGTSALCFPDKARASGEFEAADLESPDFLISFTARSINHVLYLIGMFLHSV